MQLDRPGRPKLGHHDGDVLALLKPQSHRMVRGRRAAAVIGRLAQHRPAPAVAAHAATSAIRPASPDGGSQQCMVPTPWTFRSDWCNLTTPMPFL